MLLDCGTIEHKLNVQQCGVDQTNTNTSLTSPSPKHAPCMRPQPAPPAAPAACFSPVAQLRITSRSSCLLVRDAHGGRGLGGRLERAQDTVPPERCACARREREGREKADWSRRSMNGGRNGRREWRMECESTQRLNLRAPAKRAMEYCIACCLVFIPSYGMSRVTDRDASRQGRPLLQLLLQTKRHINDSR